MRRRVSIVKGAFARILQLWPTRSRKFLLGLGGFCSGLIGLLSPRPSFYGRFSGTRSKSSSAIPIWSNCVRPSKKQKAPSPGLNPRLFNSQSPIDSCLHPKPRSGYSMLCSRLSAIFKSVAYCQRTRKMSSNFQNNIMMAERQAMIGASILDTKGRFEELASSSNPLRDRVDFSEATAGSGSTILFVNLSVSPRRHGDRDDLTRELQRLRDEWQRDTKHISLADRIAMHPAYQRIIGHGVSALSFIEKDMKHRPGHWFWALTAITGVNPVKPEHKGQMRAMTQDWLDWLETRRTDAKRSRLC